jgi:DHA1 family bicyclomycin/chloramphenicol resistance-like MFS transporter
MPIRRDSFVFTVFLGAVSALPPLSIDMGLPGIPAIERAFPDAAGRGPLTLSLFMVGFALAPLICGPLADRFGRRLTLLVGLVVFSLSAGCCAVAGSFSLLLGCRLVQGLAAGACAVVPFAIVRDSFSGATARNRLSQVAAVLGIAPMVAPVLGGWVMTVADWRTIYAAQAISGVLIFIVAAIGLAETLPPERRRPIHPASLIGSYRAVLGDGPFRGFALVYALGFGCMFTYISGSPSVFMGGLGLSGTVFSYLFAITSCGVLLGSLLSARLSTRHVSSRKIMTVGMVLMAAGAFGALGLTMAGVVHTYTLMPLVWLVIFCFGLTAPSTNHEALHGLPHVAGAAAGIMRCGQMVAGAVASALIAALEPLHHPVMVMTLIMAAFVLVAGSVYARLGPIER